MQYELMILMQSYAIHMGNDGSKRAKDHEVFTAKSLGFLLLPPWLPWDKAKALPGSSAHGTSPAECLDAHSMVMGGPKSCHGAVVHISMVWVAHRNRCFTWL